MVHYSYNNTVYYNNSNNYNNIIMAQLLHAIPLLTVAGCPMFPNASDDMLLLNATSSQAPGTQLSFVCTTELLPRNIDVITITCQVNGLWQPSVEDKHCQKVVGKFKLT